MAIIKLFSSKKDDEDKGEDNEENVVEGEEEFLFEEEFSSQDSYEGESKIMTLYRQFSSFFLVRMFILMVSIFAVLFLFYSLLKLAFGLLISIPTLFRIPSFRNIVIDNISNVKISLIGLVGLLIALFSPSLGITIIAAYCMMNLDDEKSSYLLRFLETRLKEFEED